MHEQYAKLVPLKRFDDGKLRLLARRFINVTSKGAVRSDFKDRGLTQELADFCESQDEACKALISARACSSRKLAASVIFDERGLPVGLAKVCPVMPLKKKHVVPMLPAVSVESVDLHVNSPYVTAWVVEDNTLNKTLLGTYEQLPDRTPDGSCWTVEPVRAPAAYHEVLRLTGFREAGRGRFDMGEQSRQARGPQILYVHPAF